MDTTELQQISAEVVAHLQASGFSQTRIGHKQGRAYPAVKRGVWTVALEFDLGIGRICPWYEQIGYPHWHWYLTPNLELWNVGYAMGTCLLTNPDAEVLADIMTHVLHDPCWIPYAFASENFECPACSQTWEIRQSGQGGALDPLLPLDNEPVTEPIEGWTEDYLRETYGEAAN